ncbi:Ser/Thr protein phosphatase family protein [Aspergillus alliaceus]|uniref:Ser/Thr protein phosphatase family protein n=1 Tax=Petromyces alliaceus TaxID=209559 RepID=UPI0012A55864|nr:Metallo-dependent phosphatase-like protein [Aspergillus alliaceus]KAB8229516.1 Metallo-dependent phosphatase-like protein [Aspergillus alliaceus]
MGRLNLLFTALLSASALSSTSAYDEPILTPLQQPEAHDATTGPSRGPLPWGKINFIHTTDTHGWLEGHMNEPSSGGDWGDFVSFVNRMRDKANDLKVDLLVVDTGDLHDGNGLSDISKPKGAISDSIFANVEYDLLTIGNHGVQQLDEARNIQANISKVFADRYLTSNVYIKEESEEPIGEPYRYFTTKNGIRIMAFGVLYDDKKNDQKIQIDSAAQMMQRSWFTDAMAKEVDLYILIGHGSLRRTRKNPKGSDAFLDFEDELRKKLKSANKNIPIQVIGGHTHIRDFRCFDELTSGLQSGKYGDTVGWLALDNIEIKNWKGATTLTGVPTPTRTCPPTSMMTFSAEPTSSKVPHLDRRYLDWNVRTFMYHATGPNETDKGKFDTPLGRKVTHDITFARHALNLTYVLGCAKQTWCLWCVNETDKGNIMTLAKPAWKDTVVNSKRRNNPRAAIITGTTFRYDLFKGPFTVGDALAVVPYTDTFYYAEVDFQTYLRVLTELKITRSSTGSTDEPLQDNEESDWDPTLMLQGSHSKQHALLSNVLGEPPLTPGYVTVDDFGAYGDDTNHTKFKSIGPNLNLTYVEANFPPQWSPGQKLDLVVTAHMEKKIRPIVQPNKPNDRLPLYMDDKFTTGDILPEYARRNWNSNTTQSCPIGR